MNNFLKKDFKWTIIACFAGYVVQAVINNFAPLLFITFHTSYQISLDKIAVLVTINFGVQLLVDLAATRLVDKIGYRISMVLAHLMAAVGLVSMAFLPEILPSAYSGLVIAIVLYAIGGGLLEVLVSPIVEACPTKRKEATMSLLHSFYCWGHVFVVLASTLFFVTVGISHWKILACIWGLIPLANLFLFTQVPINTLVEEKDGLSIRDLFRNKIFWVLMLLMVCAGASEQGMSQWASAFAEAGLGVSKTVGDLAGPCAFAVCMGCARLFYAKYSEKIPLQKFMVFSGCLCIMTYFVASLVGNPVINLVGCALCGFSVGILWPGSFSIAAKLCRKGGTAMFALLALGGDLGCAGGPALVGMVAERLGGDLKRGILAAVVFPILLLVGLALVKILPQKTATID